jgi:hypothetical protein
MTLVVERKEMPTALQEQLASAVAVMFPTAPGVANSPLKDALEFPEPPVTSVSYCSVKLAKLLFAPDETHPPDPL